MTGTIFNIQKYSIHDGPGIRTIVFFKGCPMECKWCANPESARPSRQVGFKRSLCVECGRCILSCNYSAIKNSSKYGKMIDYGACINCGECVKNCPSEALQMLGKEIDIEGILKEVKKDMVFYRKTGGGVTVSGGEPFAQPDFLLELLKGCKNNHISTAIETTGYTTWDNLSRCAPYIDLFLYDIKHMDSSVHEAYTGVKNEIILSNLKQLMKSGKRIWIRMPTLQGIHDSFENLDKVLAFISGYKNVEQVEILPYHTLGVGKYAQFGRDYELIFAEPPKEEAISNLLKQAKVKYPETKIIVRAHM